MYTVMVVDDEKVICTGMQHRISMMSNLNIGDIYIAFNGKEALALAQKVKPDIIITDIKMPEMGGIELINILSKTDSHIKFIVLSGYDDYEYIRSAFKLGIIDYLLKPASTAELENHLQAAIQKIDEENALKKKYPISPHEKSMNDIKLLLTQLFFDPYIKLEEITGQFPGYQEALPFPYFAVGYLKLNGATANTNNLDLINKHLENFKLPFLTNSLVKCVELYDKEGFIFVFNFSKTEELINIRNSLQRFVDSFINEFHICLTPAISIVRPGFANLKSLYFQVTEAIKYKIVFKPGQLIDYSKLQVSDEKFTMSKDDLKELETVISSQSMEQIDLLIEKWFTRERLKGQFIENIKLIYDITLKNLDSLMDSQQYTIINNKDKSFYQFNTLEELKNYLKEYANRILKLISQQQQNEKTLVDVAKKYLEENFRKDINLARVSNMLSINYSYFSKLFKDQTGMTFTAYLTKLRMEEAKKLLNDPTNRITEISSMVGYDNTHNFSRAFKNYFGISPKEYRK